MQRFFPFQVRTDQTVDRGRKIQEKHIGEKNLTGIVLRIPYDSINCIRFDGYVLSSVQSPGHPNRNCPNHITASLEKCKLFV